MIFPAITIVSSTVSCPGLNIATDKPSYRTHHRRFQALTALTPHRDPTRVSVCVISGPRGFSSPVNGRFLSFRMLVDHDVSGSFFGCSRDAADCDEHCVVGCDFAEQDGEIGAVWSAAAVLRR